MARRNLVRTFGAASMLAVGVVAGALASTAPAGAHHVSFTPDARVKVFDTHFEPALVYLKRGQTVQFDLQPGASAEHTVTLEHGECQDRPRRQCDLGFTDPNHPPVYRFFTADEYPYYSRLARERGDVDMRGRIVVTATPPPSTVPPSSSTTTTTRPAPTTTTTAAAPTTTTTASPAPAPTTTTGAGPVRPSVTPDPAPSSTTTTAMPAGPAPGGADTPAGQSKADEKADEKGRPKARDRDRDRGEEQAGGAPTTAPAPPGSVPSDAVFDPAYLTPGLGALPTPSPTDPGDQAALDVATVVSLLDTEANDDDDDDTGRLTLYGLGVLALMFLAWGLWRWLHRSSRYFPA